MFEIGNLSLFGQLLVWTARLSYDAALRPNDNNIVDVRIPQSIVEFLASEDFSMVYQMHACMLMYVCWPIHIRSLHSSCIMHRQVVYAFMDASYIIRIYNNYTELWKYISLPHWPAFICPCTACTHPRITGKAKAPAHGLDLLQKPRVR